MTIRNFLPYMLQRFAGVSGILASMGMMETVEAQAEFAKLYFDIVGDPEVVALDMLRTTAILSTEATFPARPQKLSRQRSAILTRTASTTDCVKNLPGKRGCAFESRNGGMTE